MEEVPTLLIEQQIKSLSTDVSQTSLWCLPFCPKLQWGYDL